MLRWLDEMSLFEPGSESLHRFLLYPGGIFRFAGTYLTQLLYYPALGSGVLILIWLLCVWLARISFDLKGMASPLCYMVPFSLLASVLALDEACLTFESQGYVFYNTLGFAFSLASYALFIALRRNTTARIVIPLILPLLYPLAGFFALLSALMCVVRICLTRKEGSAVSNWVTVGVSLVLMIMIPKMYYLYCPGTTADNQYLYLRGLPEFTMNGYDWYLWSPFVGASAFCIFFVIISIYADILKLHTGKITGWLSAMLFALGILGCLSADSGKSEQLRAKVLMIKAIENKEWSRVSHVMSLTKESPDYTMCVLDNLARAYTRSQRLDLQNMMAVAADFRHDENFTITAFVNVPVNHYIGRFNQSHRWATEHYIQYGPRVFFIKYIVLNALMNGDLEFARKFNRILGRTMFHKKWAEDIDRYIDNPTLLTTLPDYDFLMQLRQEEIIRGE